MAAIYLGLSHKGGTGRSVSLANIAYWLAASGNDVCIVDLDLGSPTMGTVLGRSDLGTGTRDGLGVHSFLRGRPAQIGSVASALISVWGDNLHPTSDHAGNFALLPGTRGGDIDLDAEGIRDGLRYIFDEISGRFDYVFADLRSGLSNVAAALTQPEFKDDDVTWLFFYRWTPQQLAGLEDLAERVADSYREPPGARVGFVRTAFSDPAGYDGPLQTYVLDLHAKLDRQEQRAKDRVDGGLVLGAVPLDPILQWEERILREVDERRGSKETVNSFRSIAEIIRIRKAN